MARTRPFPAVPFPHAAPKCTMMVAGMVAGTLFLLAAAVQPARAAEWRAWCHHEGLGWHFYCDRGEGRTHEAPEQAAPDPPAGQGAGDARTAVERIGDIRRALADARAVAILDPTRANVAAYLRLQQETLQRAAAFSDAFRRTVWATPGVDYTLERPVGALAKRVWSDERRRERGGVLARLGARYGLIYLGHADCGGCKVFGPLLRAFATRHGLHVLAVSLDGAALEGWPEAVADNGRAARLGLAGAPVPAVALFDTETRTVLPVGHGVMAEDELAERIFVLTARESGHDY